MATFKPFAANALKYVTKSSSSSWNDGSAKQGSNTYDSYDYVGAIKFGNPNILSMDWSSLNITQIDFTPIYGDAGYHDKTKDLYLYGATRTNIAESTGASLIGDYIGKVNSGCIVKKGASQTITFSNSSNSSAFSKFVNYLQSGTSNVIVLYTKESIADGTGGSGSTSNYSQNYLSITDCTITIYYETTAPVTTISGSFSDGTVGTYYSDSLTCDGDTPITWRVSSGSLPSGLSLTSSGNSCYVSGTPTTAGSYSFGITASNSTGSDTVYYGMKIAPAITAPSSISSTFANGTVGTSYSSHVQSNGDTPITWSRYSGTLPPGLTLSAGSNSQQGYLKGTPTTAGSYTFTLKAANSAGSTTKQFTITIANPSYTITASAGTGGTISPSGSISVTSGGSQTFTISPSSGYAINYVSVNGTNKGAITSYTFSNVTSNQTISAYFKKVYTITASAGIGGTISPSGTTTVDSGSSKTYTITPNNGYIINYVEVDGVNKGAITSHTFSNITSNHTITASFKPAVGIYIGDKEVLEIYSKTNNSIIKTITGYINKNGTIEIFYNGD